nr:phage integrase family protein [Paraburkholderia phosphatilytica]
MFERTSKLAAAAPAPDHPVGLWFRPLVAQRLAGEGIATPGELVATCNRRGGSWWRPVPPIGLLRAHTIVAWLRRHAGRDGGRRRRRGRPPDRADGDPCSDRRCAQ